MKKIFILLITSQNFLIATGQSITGSWEGTLNIQGTEIPIVFHIKKDSADKLSATFDSPKQQAYNLACSGVITNGDSLVLQMKMINGKYEGLLSKNRETLSGQWFQGGASLPLDMKKTSDIVISKEIKRPQTPKPPFNYLSEDVEYFNADKSIHFGATFTVPKPDPNIRYIKAPAYPAVILITGSGKQDRDETLFGHKPFAVIADYLTSQGIAVLRVDDRGVGKTTGDFSKSTTEDFAKDVEAGIDYLKSRTDVDISKIGLAGHSEGGIIAPMVAAKRKDIKFIVLLAAPGIKIAELMEQQSFDVSVAAGIPENELQLYKPLYRNLVAVAIGEKDMAVASKKASDIFIDWQNKTPEQAVKNTTGVTDEKSRTEFITGFVTQMKQPWFNYFMKFNPADYLQKVRCAVLALNGEKDVQVAAVPNLKAIDKILADNHVSNFKTQSLPGLNHLFQHCKSCTVAEYGEIEETFSPEALQIITAWIKKILQ